MPSHGPMKVGGWGSTMALIMGTAPSSALCDCVMMTCVTRLNNGDALAADVTCRVVLDMPGCTSSDLMFGLTMASFSLRA